MKLIMLAASQTMTKVTTQQKKDMKVETKTMTKVATELDPVAAFDKFGAAAGVAQAEAKATVSRTKKKKKKQQKSLQRKTRIKQLAQAPVLT